MRFFTIPAMLALMAITPPAFGQDGDDTGATIYAKNKFSVVDVTSNIHLASSPVVLRAGGSGFFIKGEGNDALVVTNAHVVKLENDEYGMWGKVREYKYEVILSARGRKYSAELVGWNSNVDVALLKVSGIDPNDYTPVTLGDSNTISIGETVYAIGAPAGESNTITKGIVNQLHITLGMNYVEDFIKTDAPINPGNSGGPLINSKSEVIGINSAKRGGPFVDGMGYAIPINLASIELLKKGGEVRRRDYGIECMLKNFHRRGKLEKPTIQDMIELFKETGVEDPHTLEMICKATYPSTDTRYAVINSLAPESVLAKAGLQKGDVVIRSGHCQVRSGMDLRLCLLSVDEGDVIEWEVLRADGHTIATKKITVQMKELDDEKDKKK